MNPLTSFAAATARAGSGLLCLAALALSGALAACGGGEDSTTPSPSTPAALSSADRPNIIIITLDTTRADRFGCYGYSKAITPNLDRLAEGGARFSRAYAQAAVTPVSHASMMTGLNPYSHGLRVLHGTELTRLSEKAVTLAEVLAAEGYDTAAFLSAFPVSEYFGFDQGFSVFDAEFLVQTRETIISDGGVVNTGMNQRRADKTTRRALDWLALERDAPYLLWVHYFDPHDPFVGPPKELLDSIALPEGLDREGVLRELYDTEILFMDQQIGLLLREIERQGESDGQAGSVVAVLADHGEGLGDHDWWSHGKLYEEQINIPFILNGPTITPGTQIDDVVRSIDLMPTLLELAGVAPAAHPPMEGLSVMPLIRGESESTPRLAYADSISKLIYAQRKNHQTDRLFMLVEGPLKFILHLQHPDQSELYDLSTDPKELTNLYDERPRDVRRLEAGLDALDFMRTRMRPEPRDDIPGDITKRLEALGYLK